MGFSVKVVGAFAVKDNCGTWVKKCMSLEVDDPRRERPRMT